MKDLSVSTVSNVKSERLHCSIKSVLQSQPLIEHLSMINVSLKGWLDSILSITAIRSWRSMGFSIVTIPHQNWTLYPAKLILGSRIQHPRERSSFITVPVKKVPLKRFQSIVTAGIRRRGALHVGVLVWRRRRNTQLHAMGEPTRITLLTVLISQQWMWGLSVSIGQETWPIRLNDNDVIKQAIGLLARVIIWSAMWVVAGWEPREVASRMIA